MVFPVFIAEHLTPLLPLEVAYSDVQPAASVAPLVDELVEGKPGGLQPLDREADKTLRPARVVPVRHEVGGPSGGVRARRGAPDGFVEFRAPVSARDDERPSPRLAQGVEQFVDKLNHVSLHELRHSVVYLEPGGRLGPLELLECEVLHKESLYLINVSSVSRQPVKDGELEGDVDSAGAYGLAGGPGVHAVLAVPCQAEEAGGHLLVGELHHGDLGDVMRREVVVQALVYHLQLLERPEPVAVLQQQADHGVLRRPQVLELALAQRRLPLSPDLQREVEVDEGKAAGEVRAAVVELHHERPVGPGRLEEPRELASDVLVRPEPEGRAVGVPVLPGLRDALDDLVNLLEDYLRLRDEQHHERHARGSEQHLQELEDVIVLEPLHEGAYPAERVAPAAILLLLAHPSSPPRPSTTPPRGRCRRRS